MYVRVYAPDGEPFDVTRERADRLILQEGWTQTPPAAAEIVEPIVAEAAPEVVDDAPTMEEHRSRVRVRKPSVASTDPIAE